MGALFSQSSSSPTSLSNFNGDRDSVCHSYSTGSFDSLGNKSEIWIDVVEGRIHKVSNWDKGVLSGKMYIFRSSGCLHSELMFRNGKLNGDAKFYSSSGVLLAIYNYHNNLLSEFKFHIIDPESPPYQKTFLPEW